MISFTNVKGFAFDLDGVLADTARFHEIAWHQIADELGTEWTSQLSESLKGIDRMTSLEKILAAGNRTSDFSEEEKKALTDKKNDNYRELISTLTPKDILPGMENFLKELKNAGYKMSVASASKNAPFIIERLGLTDYFEAIVDPDSVSYGKPDPAIFVAAAGVLGLAPEQVIGVEDSAAGIQSINDAGEISIGIGNSRILKEAQVNFSSTSEVALSEIASKLS